MPKVKGTLLCGIPVRLGGEWVAIGDHRGNKAVLKDPAPATALRWRGPLTGGPACPRRWTAPDSPRRRAARFRGEGDRRSSSPTKVEEGLIRRFHERVDERLKLSVRKAKRDRAEATRRADCLGEQYSHLELTVGSDDLGPRVRRCAAS